MSHQMQALRSLSALAIAAALLTGMATAQNSPPVSASPTTDDQTKFNAASALYVRDIGYFNDAVVKLRTANETHSDMSCRYADVAVVSLGSAQNQLETMIDLVESAHQDSTAWHKDYDENAAQLVLRKDALHRSCG